MSYTRGDLKGNPELQKQEMDRKVHAAEFKHRREGLELQGKANRIALIALVVAVVAIVAAIVVSLFLDR